LFAPSPFRMLHCATTSMITYKSNDAIPPLFSPTTPSLSPLHLLYVLLLLIPDNASHWASSLFKLREKIKGVPRIWLIRSYLPSITPLPSEIGYYYGSKEQQYYSAAALPMIFSYRSHHIPTQFTFLSPFCTSFLSLRPPFSSLHHRPSSR